jgi:hypothetical protein
MRQERQVLKAWRPLAFCVAPLAILFPYSVDCSRIAL